MKLKRKPTSPGEILKEEFLIPLNMTQKKLAEHLKCDVKVINRIINEKSSVSAEMALKLGAALNTSPEFWTNAQRSIDVYNAQKSIGKLPKPIFKAR